MAIRESVPREGYIERYQVDSFDPRRAGRVYVVALRDNGSWECSCPAWIFRGKRGCKHIDAVQESRRQERTPVRRLRRPSPERPEPLEEHRPVRREITVGDEQFHITRIQALKEEMAA